MILPASGRDYLLVSVQRTATRFLQRMFAAADIKTAQIHAVGTRSEQLEGWLQHNEAEDLPILVPMRHPFSVAHSWRLRLDSLEKMFEQYRYLAWICERSRPLYLPVDHPERAKYLQQMSAGVDAELKTDWQKYGHKHGCAYLSAGEQDQIDELCARPFISQFYDAEVPHGT